MSRQKVKTTLLVCRVGSVEGTVLMKGNNCDVETKHVKLKEMLGLMGWNCNFNTPGLLVLINDVYK